jgi:hypothetical protein
MGASHPSGIRRIFRCAPVSRRNRSPRQLSAMGRPRAARRATRAGPDSPGACRFPRITARTFPFPDAPFRVCAFTPCGAPEALHQHHQYRDVARRHPGDARRLTQRPGPVGRQLLPRLDAQRRDRQVVDVLRHEQRLRPVEPVDLGLLARQVPLVLDQDLRLLQRVVGQGRRAPYPRPAASAAPPGGARVREAHSPTSASARSVFSRFFSIRR